MTGIKEDIILERCRGVSSFSFELKTGGLTLRELDGQYCVTDGDTVVFSFGDLEVLDSFTGADEATDDWDAHRTIASINVQTIQANNKYVITLTVDEDFLTAPGTVYPVYIDPSFNVQSTYIKDTFISEGSPNSNYGNNTELKLGYGASSKRNRVLVQFTNMINGVNRPGLTPSTINSAKYYMYCTTTYTSTPYVDAYMIPLGVTEWSDTSATWNNAAASTLNSAVLQGSTRVGSSGWYNFDVTNAYTSWFNALRSRGLMFKMRIESATENYYRHFASANYTANSSRLPYLAVNYGTETTIIQLSPSSCSIGLGEIRQLSVLSNLNYADIIWSSSNKNVATISSNGLVTALAAGTTTIKVQSRFDVTKYDLCLITVEYRNGWTYFAKPTILARSEWNALDYVIDRLVDRTREPQRIIFHHSATKFDSTDINTVVTEIKRIQTSHMNGDPLRNEPGKCDIAYHFIIDPSGRIWQGALIDNYQRGHANGYFDDIGVLVLGDFEPRALNLWTPNVLNQQQKDAMIRLSRWLCFEYELLLIDSEQNAAPITTHRTVCTYTECPGDNMANWVENDLRQIINNSHSDR